MNGPVGFPTSPSAVVLYSISTPFSPSSSDSGVCLMYSSCVAFIAAPRKMLKSIGDSIDPCFSPVFSSNGTPSPHPSIFTVAIAPWCSDMMRFRSLGGVPSLRRISHIVSLCTLSYAFVRSIYDLNSFMSLSIDCAVMILDMMSASTVLFPATKPHCESGMQPGFLSVIFRNLLRIILSSSFPQCDITLRPR